MLEFNFKHMARTEVKEFDFGWFGQAATSSHLYFIGKPINSNRIAHIISTATGKSACHRVLSHEVEMVGSSVKVCSNCRKKFKQRMITAKPSTVRLAGDNDNDVFDVAIQNVSSFPIVQSHHAGRFRARTLVPVIEGGNHIMKSTPRSRGGNRTLVSSIESISQRFIKSAHNGIQKLGTLRSPQQGLNRLKKELLWATINNKVTSFNGVFTLFTGDAGDELHTLCRFGGKEDALLAAQLNATATVCEVESVEIGLMMSISGIDTMSYTVVAITSDNGYVNYYELPRPTAQDMTLTMQYVSMVYDLLEMCFSGNRDLYPNS